MARDDFQQAALRATYRVSAAIATAPSLQRIAALILREATRAIPATKASLMLFDPQTEQLTIRAAIGMPPALQRRVTLRSGEGISGRVWAENRPLRVADVATLAQPRRRRYRSRSLLSVPIAPFPAARGCRPLGVINMADRRRGEFTEDDLHLLTALANQTAAYLHLCQLADAQAQAREFEQAMTIARRVQEQLLPPPVCRLARMELAGRCIPCARVGGDLFDYLVDRQGNLTVVIADVSGHHVPAALTMTAFRALVRHFIQQPDVALGTMLTRINAALYDDLARAEQLISCVLFRVVPRDRTCTVATAGHPALLWQRAGRARIQSIASDGDLLGLVRTSVFETTTVSLAPGDRVVGVTDGVPQQRNARASRYGWSRLQTALRRHAAGSAARCVRALLHDHAAFRQQVALDDDLTVVTLQVRR